MKRYIGVIVAIVGLCAGIAIVSIRSSNKLAETEREADRVRLQRDYFERAPWLRNNPDPKAYKEEVVTFLRWYFKQVDEHVERFQENKEFDEYLSELDKRAEKGKDEKQSERKAAYDYERKLFDQMRDGKYAPLWTATDKGMRLDILTSDVKMERGEPAIHLDLVVWGAQRELRDDGKLKRVLTSANFTGKVQLFDATNKLLGEVTFDGDPSSKIDDPERRIWAFPQQTILGYYALPQFPPQASRAEITFNVTSRSPSGGEGMSTFLWKLDVPADWKAASNDAFAHGAQEQVRPQEEIDPAGAAKVAQKPKGKHK